MKKHIYLDHAATTPLNKQVYKAMKPYLIKNYGNPSSMYTLGQINQEAITKAREQVAQALNANPNEIYFTSSGSEANNWAIKGIAYANKHKGNHIITSCIEHHSILNTCKQLEQEGFQVTYLPVNEKGIVESKSLLEAITDKTILISIMRVNNEIGTVQPIASLNSIAKTHHILFHTDAVQAIGSFACNVKDLKIDLLSLSGHKFYGPKGVGALYIKKGTVIEPLINGGGQENHLRAGTENVPAIVGLGEAIQLQSASNNKVHILQLRNYFIKQLLLHFPQAIINGSINHRVYSNVNVTLPNIEATTVLLALNEKGIFASTGSACNAGSLTPSHVLLAIGLTPEQAFSTIRFTLGTHNTKKDIDYTIKTLKDIYTKLTKGGYC